MREGARILVVDDSTTLRKLVEIAYRGTSAVVDFAGTGAEAVARATSHPPDVILLDFLLPDMRSVDVCARLAELSDTAGVPIVIMSAKREGVREAFTVFPSVVDFIAKPFGMDEIRSRLGAAMRGATQAGPAAEVALSSDLAVTPLLDVLRFLSTLKLTGCLTLELVPRVEIYLHDGDAVLCASYGEPAVADLEGIDLSRAPRAAIEKASAAQARTGKPALATLAEAGLVPREMAPLALRDAGTRLLSSALEARAGAVSWRSLGKLPDHVATFGRPLAVTGIALERRRGARTTEEVPASFLGAVYQRTPRFSRKLAGARLSANERKLLALFDGETPIATVLERAGLTADKAIGVCNRLAAVDLIELREPQTSNSALSGIASGIALWSPADAELESSLRALLQRRIPRLDLTDLAPEADLAGAVLRIRPRLLLVSAPASPEADQVIDAVRSTPTVLVAVLDATPRGVVDACLAAGFHAVLAKPIHLNDLERLLSS
jgi:CheY-like chemotaxis protein